MRSWSINKEKTRELLRKWVSGEIFSTTKQLRLVLEDDCCYSYGYHFLLGARYPDKYVIAVNMDDWITQYGRKSTVTGQQRWELLKVIREERRSDELVLVNNAWEGATPPVGLLLSTLIMRTGSGTASAAIMRMRPELFNPEGRIHYSLWEGDPFKLRQILGSSLAYDLVVVEALAHHRGLEEAQAWADSQVYLKGCSLQVKNSVKEFLIRQRLNMPEPLGCSMVSSLRAMEKLAMAQEGARDEMASLFLLSRNKYKKYVGERFLLAKALKKD